MKNSTHIKFRSLLLCLSMLSGSAFGQIVVDFEFEQDNSTAIDHGDEIVNQYNNFVTFGYGGPGSRELRAYDTSTSPATSPFEFRDPDLVTIGSSHETNDEVSDWNGRIFGNSSGAGNVLIIQEAGSALVDDEAGGGIIVMTFNNGVQFHDVGVLDLDNGETATMRFYDSQIGGTLLADQVIDGIGNNSYQEVNFDSLLAGKAPVERVEFELSSSGALSGLKFTDPTVIPEPSTYALIFGGLALGVVFIKRRLTKDEPSEDEAA